MTSVLLSVAKTQIENFAFALNYFLTFPFKQTFLLNKCFYDLTWVREKNETISPSVSK